MNFKAALAAVSLVALALSAAPSAAQTSSQTGRGGGAGGESGSSSATPAQQGRGAVNQRMDDMDTNSGMMSPRWSYQDRNYGASEAGTGGGAGGESGSGSNTERQAGTRQ